MKKQYVLNKDTGELHILGLCPYSSDGFPENGKVFDTELEANLYIENDTYSPIEKHITICSDCKHNNHISKKENTKKKTINFFVIVVSIVVFIAGVIITNIIRKNNHIAYLENSSLELLNACNEVGEDFNISDFEFIKYDESESQYPSFYIKSDLFSWSRDADKEKFFEKVNGKVIVRIYHDEETGKGGLRILSGGHEYSYSGGWLGGMFKDGNRVYIKEDYSNNGTNSSGKTNSSSGKTKCTFCNGTGYVKYYYGESDLEAILSGHDPYTVGPCSSCDGKGYEK